MVYLKVIGGTEYKHEILNLASLVDKNQTQDVPNAERQPATAVIPLNKEMWKLDHCSPLKNEIYRRNIFKIQFLSRRKGKFVPITKTSRLMALWEESLFINEQNL